MIFFLKLDDAACSLLTQFSVTIGYTNVLQTLQTYVEFPTACALEVYRPRAKDDTMELPDTIATFDCKVGIFSRVKQPVMLASACGYRNPKGMYMVIASVCSFCAIALMSLTRLEAMSRQEGEVC